MRFIRTKVHGVIDYIMGIILIASPWIFGFAKNGTETWLPVVLGVAALIYSLMTNYEMGAAKVITMRTHLTLDFLSGALLALSPWLFGFSDYVYIPHVVLGIIEMGAALTTKLVPETETRQEHRTAH